MKKLTPMMQQYLEFKKEVPDAVLFFRLGDFYEIFFEDARIAARALDIVLTKRGTDMDGNEIPMCGVPHHASDSYIQKLVRAGHSVAIVEQLETPEQAKARGAKSLARGIVRIITAGTLTDDALLAPKKSNFLISVFPSSDNFDIAGCDISTGEFFIGTIGENLIDELVRLSPSEIIYPESSAELPTIKIMRGIFRTTPVYDRIFARENINETCRTIFGINDVIINPSIHLLAGYLEQTQRGAKLSFRAPYRLGDGERLLIDSASWRSLEIDEALQPGGATLLDVLDKTKTAAGGRKLRQYLRELSAEIDILCTRQEHIGHLVLNKSVGLEMGALLGRTLDVGRCFARLFSGRGSPRDLQATAEFIARLSEYKIVGRKMDPKLAALFDAINTHDGLKAELNFALSDDMPGNFRDGGVIKKGYDQSLDNMNSLASGARDIVAGLQNEYANATNITTLKIKYNGIIGYHIEVPSAKADILLARPDEFIHRQTMAGNMRFTTARLIELDNDIRSASDKAYAIEKEIVDKLISFVSDASEDLIATADLIADTDVWCALAECVSEYNWVRPKITEANEFEITGGRHPVVEYILKKNAGQFVKNDCMLTSTNTNHEHGKAIALLTGPNMAGKSTYLRQNSLIVVLSHLGSFVPADRAVVGLCDQLFSRVGASDNLAAGQSTFMVEMT
ncbi:MAG: DNA mismatch repair protein MutS, partial [Alphaproteobacteria bacterium]|nr:DNA mismatch repair protein MutS [Alphaproteobacteria bacterium]